MHERVLSWLEGVAESGAAIDFGRLAASTSGTALPDAADRGRLGALLLALGQAKGNRSSESVAAWRGGDASATSDGAGLDEAKREIARLGQMVANRDKQIADAKSHIEQLKQQVRNRDEAMLAMRDQTATKLPVGAPAKLPETRPAATPSAVAPAVAAPPLPDVKPKVAPPAPKPTRALRLRFDGSNAIEARMDGAGPLRQLFIEADFAVDMSLIDAAVRTFPVSETTPPMLFALGPVAAYLKGPTVLRLKVGRDHRDIDLVDGVARVRMAASAGTDASLVRIDDGQSAPQSFKTGPLNVERELVLGGGYLRRRWLGTISNFEIRDLAGSDADPARWPAGSGRLIFGFDGADVTAGKRL